MYRVTGTGVSMTQPDAEEQVEMLVCHARK